MKTTSDSTKLYMAVKKTADAAEELEAALEGMTEITTTEQVIQEAWRALVAIENCSEILRSRKQD